MTDDPIDQVIAEIRERTRSRRIEVIERACRDYPEHAQQIRLRLGPPSSPGAPLRASNDDAQHVGPYRLLSELGRGGQAVVYLAEDTRLHRHVALKILKGFGPLSEKVIERFRREAEVTSKLDHPGICAVYDAGVESGVPYIAMRLVHGATLAARIAEAKGSDEDFDVLVEDGLQGLKPAGVGAVQPGLTTTHQEVLAIVELVEKAARALHAAHEAGVIHRDIKPGNIMVSPDGQPVILDFGLASDEEGDFRTLTQSGDLFGTPAYMSPEQLMAQRVRLDRRTDVYSLGVTLFECLALRQPFEAPTREGIYQAIQYKEPPDIRKLNPRIPRDLKVVIETALQKDRDKRYATAQAFAEDLRRVRVSEPIAAKPVGPIGRVVRFAKRRPAMAALIGVLILAIPTIAGLGGFLAANWKEIEQQKQRALDDELERHLESGYLALAEGLRVSAIESFNLGLALRPGSIEAIAGKAMALIGQDKSEDALNLLDSHPAIVGSEDALQALRADALEKLGRKPEADDLRNKLKPPTTSLALFLAGQRDIARGEASSFRDLDAYRRAVAELSDAVARSPAARLLYDVALTKAATVAQDTGVVRRMIPALQVLWPESSTAWHQVGYAKLILNDLDGAISATQRSLEIDPKHGNVHNNLGWLFRRKGLIDQAIHEYELALVLNPRDSMVHRNLADALMEKKGQGEGAIAEYRLATEADPKNAEAWSRLGAALRSLNRIDEAIAELGRACRSDSRNAVAHDNLGTILQEDKGQIDEAIDEFHEAISIDPEYAGAHCNLAWALQNEDRFDDSILEYRIAIDLDKKNPRPNPRPHAGLGAVLRTRGRFRESFAESGRALELVGTSEPPLAERIRLDHEATRPFLQFEDRLDKVLGGAARPEEPSELVMVALAAAGRDLHALAVDLWIAAFAEQPDLRENPDEHWLDRAAPSAVLAGLRGGKNGGSLDEKARSELLAHAREWLVDEMEFWTRLVREDSAAARPRARWAFKRWKADPKLAKVRDAAELVKLPEAERDAWTKLWADVDDRLAALHQ